MKTNFPSLQFPQAASTRRFLTNAIMCAVLLISPAHALAEVPAPSITVAGAVEKLKPGEYIWAPQVAPAGPIMVIVSLQKQRAYIYRNGVIIGVSTVSTGSEGRETPVGIFTVLQKHIDHKSNLYNNAPMPFMQRLTWDGIAMHAGNIPGVPASHGCIRLPAAFAKLLYGVTPMGMTVIITDDTPVPRLAPLPAMLAADDRQTASGAGIIWQPELASAMATKLGTRAIGPKQAARAFHAVRFANDNGRALNLLISINFDLLGIEPDRATAFFQKLWSRVGRWWLNQRKKDRPFGPFDYYVVHEHPKGGARNVHVFVRAPEDAREALEKVVRNRLQKLTKLDCLGRAIHFMGVEKAGGVAKYTLKGIDLAFASHFHMEAKDQGFIPGRRIAISRSIGHAARVKAGWVRKRRPRG